MEKMYFTFGSWEKFPHHNTYMVVVGVDKNDCIEGFRRLYPDIHENTVNCSSYYSEDRWLEHGCKFYEGMQPAEILVTASAEREGCQNLLRKAVTVMGRSCGYWYDKQKRKTYVCERIGTTEEELKFLGIDLEEVLA